MSFNPRFSYTVSLVRHLAEIEGARAVVELLPLPPDTILRLRHDAFQRSTRSSTQIEGNTLGDKGVRRAIAGAERKGTAAEQEVRNYWRALDRVDEFSGGRGAPTEAFVRQLHRIVIVRPAGRRGHTSAYRTTECPVVDTLTHRIDYAPPEPRDVPGLMRDLFEWLPSKGAQQLSAPIRAALLSHRFLSIHPFEDGNGRTARLLATAELWRSSYRMRGFLSFDEYFSAGRERYYESLQMGLPTNFYDGRHDPDHTPWIEYFVGTIARAAASLHNRAAALHRIAAKGTVPWERLSRRQQQVLTRILSRRLERLPKSAEIQPSDIEDWFGVSGNTAREWLREWTASRFILPVQSGSGLRVRRYRLGEEWRELVEGAQRAPKDSQGGEPT